jgi:hypothetical protein
MTSFPVYLFDKKFNRWFKILNFEAYIRIQVISKIVSSTQKKVRKYGYHYETNARLDIEKYIKEFQSCSVEDYEMAMDIYIKVTEQVRDARIAAEKKENEAK